MPSLYVLAGPNGAGKTTFYFTAVEQGFIDKSLPFINTDLIASNELGGYSEENFLRAENIVRQRIAYHIENNESFMIESNLARQSDYTWLKTIARKGYEIIVYFLCTSDIDINIERVKKRIKEGGHSVPENIIVDRYRMALLYFKSEILNFNEVYLIDNSKETAEEIAVVKKGELIKKKNDTTEWINKLLCFVERLKNKN